MSTDELDAYLADPPPLPADVAAELADFADRLERMTNDELDDFFAAECAYPEPKETRRHGTAGR